MQVLVGLRLFLPEAWTSEPGRCSQASVPEDAMMPRTKGEIALVEIDRIPATDARFDTVLADAGYGTSAAFRHGLDGRGLRWAVGIVKSQKMYDADVQIVPPAGRARKPVPDREPCDAGTPLTGLVCRQVAWRHETKGKLTARFAMCRVRVDDDPTRGNNCHLPGAEIWLVGEWRSSGKHKYYLSNLPADTTHGCVPGRGVAEGWRSEIFG